MPGLNGTGCARKVLVQGSLGVRGGSVCCPVDMRSRSLTRIALRLLLGSAGASSGKNLSTSSSRLSFPSAMASPTAVEVKLLLSEYSECGASASIGRPPALRHHVAVAHEHEAVHRVDVLVGRLDEARTADDETPCASGLLRGRSAAAASVSP